VSASDPQYDVLVLGGGPAGSTTALVLAREGKRVLLLERSTFPRLHVGESFLPRNLALIRELGLEAELRKIPQVEKRGAEFIMGHGRDGAVPRSTRCSWTLPAPPGPRSTKTAP
jgi:flavin-dependent dehydrogenase